jgi:hypothetical protein
LRLLVAISGTKKVKIFRAHSTVQYKRHINNRYIGNFMYTSVVALLCVVEFRYVGILAAVLCGGGGVVVCRAPPPPPTIL